MVRAAAKNFAAVAIVTVPFMYCEFLQHLDTNGGQTSLELREKLARHAFARVANYDRAIETYFFRNRRTLEAHDELHLSFDQARLLRYGENPHQQATFYREPGLIPQVTEA